MLSGNIFCSHCGGRLTTIRYRDSYTRADGTIYSVNEIMYCCYHKSRKLCQCDGQTTYRAERVDESIRRIIEQITPAYDRFKSWAEEFDKATLEQQKMIACHLFKRIEVGRGYQIKAELNMTYKQFCSEWGGGDLLGEVIG